MSVIVKGGGGAAKQEKTVTAGTYVKEVLPDTGKLLSRVLLYPTPTEEKTVTPTTSEQTITPTEGYHIGKVILEAMEDVTPEVTAQTPIIAEIIEGLVGKAQGATASAETILKGYSAYVNGKLVDGTFKPVDLAALFGCTKYAVDNVTFSSESYVGDVAVSHSLGIIPKIAIITVSNISGTSYVTTGVGLATSGGNFRSIILTGNRNYIYGNSSANTATSSKVTFQGTASTQIYKSGVEYTLITMA